MSSSSLALALQITATNGAAGVLNALRKHLVDVGRLSQENARHFDTMTRSLQRAGNAFATAFYIKDKLKPGVEAAADLEESMLRVKGNIAQVGDKTDDLTKKLKQVRDTAREVSKAAPFSAKEVVDIQGALLKAGVDLNAVVGANGAAAQAAKLSSISGIAPADVGDALARIGKQFNFRPSEYKNAADILAKAEAASPGSLQELLYSLKQSGFTQKMLGVSFQDSATIAAAMTPLGLEAGTSINRFILDSAGLTRMQRESMLKLGIARMHDGKFENLLYKNGKYVGLEAEITMLRQQFAKIPLDQEKAQLAHRIFGQEGMRAALGLGTGDDLFGDMKKQMATSLSLDQRMDIVMGGANSSGRAAMGTVQTLMAQAFDPVLGKLKTLADMLNNAADGMARYLQAHPAVNGLVAGGGFALAGAAGAYGLFSLAKGAGSGMRLLRGLSGTAGGIAAGKAVQAATGVTPVFVTNWPGTSVTGALDGVPGAAVGAAAGGWLGRLKGGWKLLRAAPSLSAIGELGLGAVGSAGLAVAGAGAAGWGAGSWLNDHFVSGTKTGDYIGATIAQILAKLGDKEAQRAINVTLNVDGKQLTTVVNARNEREAKRR